MAIQDSMSQLYSLVSALGVLEMFHFLSFHFCKGKHVSEYKCFDVFAQANKQCWHGLAISNPKYCIPTLGSFCLEYLFSDLSLPFIVMPLAVWK